MHSMFIFEESGEESSVLAFFFNRSLFSIGSSLTLSFGVDLWEFEVGDFCISLDFNRGLESSSNPLKLFSLVISLTIESLHANVSR